MSTDEYTSTCEHGGTIRFIVSSGPIFKGSAERIDPPCCKEEK